MSAAPEVIELVDPGRPDWRKESASRPIRVLLWRPSEAVDPPLVLLSHGTGGAARDLDWLAESLVAEGFAVAGVDHHGNNWVDGYLPEGFAFAYERPRDLSFVVDHLDGVDKDRIGATGFSLGGYTVLALAGARIDPGVFLAVARGQVQAPPLPEFPDLIEQLNAKYPDGRLEGMVPDAIASKADDRVRAVFAIAPAIGPLVEAASLREIDRPVAIRYGDADDNSVPEINALYYGAHIPGSDVRSAGADVGHYVFSGEEQSADAVDVRNRVAADAVAFFGKHLGEP